MEIGELVSPPLLPQSGKPDILIVAITAVTFDSGIKIFNVAAGGAETELPPSGSPHWGATHVYPAVYVREGGSGETKNLKVKVEWSQVGHDGSAKLEGRSTDGGITISGDFSISGERGTAEVSCTFTKRPSTVQNFGAGIAFEWRVTAGGETVDATGGNLLKLYFVDAKPKPIGWSYKAHYLTVIDWATSWASGTAGETGVRDALWDKFSTGSAARNPHVTGFSYWKTNHPVQDLKTLVQPDGGAREKGWSCKAIAHAFMECLALHGISCVEIILDTADHTQAFLVHNWDVEPKPLPNWQSHSDCYYAGSWKWSPSPPLSVASATGLTQEAGGALTAKALQTDMTKRPGVPAQGQSRAPLEFNNHWIVELDGKLYDTSYGAVHPNSMTDYAKQSLAGWLVGMLKDTSPVAGLGEPPAYAWIAHAISKHTLLRSNASHN